MLSSISIKRSFGCAFLCPARLSTRTMSLNLCSCWLISAVDPRAIFVSSSALLISSIV